MRIEHHSKTNVWVREDGCVYLPQSGLHPAHWTFGYSHNKGYLCVRIKGKDYKVHRLVAECFIPNTENKPFIDHINRDRSDNRVENLRWATNSDNQRNTLRHDRIEARGGTHCYEDINKYALERYYRDIEKSRSLAKVYGARYRKTHKNVRFSDGTRHRLPNSEAALLLAIPVNLRVFTKNKD